MFRNQQGIFLVFIAVLMLTSGLYGELSAGSLSSIPGGRIGGVLRSEEGVGLASVRIDVYMDRVQQNSLQTGARGEYRIESLSPGLYTLEFRHQNAEPVRRDVMVYKARDSFCNVRMETEDTFAADTFLPYRAQNSSLDLLKPRPIPVSGPYVAPYMPPEPQENYVPLQSLPFYNVTQRPQADIALSANTAYFSYLRRLLADGILPDPEGIRVEEMLAYMQAEGPISSPDSITVSTQAFEHPFDSSRIFVRLVLIAPGHQSLQETPFDPGRFIFTPDSNAVEQQPLPDNPHDLYVVLDCSGRMGTEAKLYLAKECMRMYIEEMEEDDRLTIFCARPEERVLELDGKDKASAYLALDHISASGSGDILKILDMVMEKEQESGDLWFFTDGFYPEETQKALAIALAKAQGQGFHCTIAGVGRNPYCDDKLYLLARELGTGYIYLDSVHEFARQLHFGALRYREPFVQDLQVKLEFAPAAVKRYRQVAEKPRAGAGAESMTASVPGTIYSGQVLSALFEIELQDDVDPQEVMAGELMLQYRSPDNAEPIYGSFRLKQKICPPTQSSGQDHMAAALFGMLLREEQDSAKLSWQRLGEYEKENIMHPDLKTMIRTSAELQP